jgi:hypothetical protein
VGVKLTAHLHAEPRSRMMELYLHSPTVLNYIIKYRDNFTFPLHAMKKVNGTVINKPSGVYDDVPRNSKAAGN